MLNKVLAKEQVSAEYCIKNNWEIFVQKSSFFGKIRWILIVSGRVYKRCVSKAKTYQERTTHTPWTAL